MNNDRRVETGQPGGLQHGNDSGLIAARSGPGYSAAVLTAFDLIISRRCMVLPWLRFFFFFYHLYRSTDCFLDRFNDQLMDLVIKPLKLRYDLIS